MPWSRDLAPYAAGLVELLELLGALNRGKRSVAADLKSPEDVATVLFLAGQADILFEGFRLGFLAVVLCPGRCQRSTSRIPRWLVEVSIG